MGKKHSKKTNTNDNSNCGPQIKKKFHTKDLTKIQPKTNNQKKLMTQYKDNPDKSFFLSGSAGTGKTFLSMYLALNEVVDPNNDFDELIIIRSIVPSREIGFLPGSIEEKTMVYEEPYVSICDELFEYSKSYDNLRNAGYIDFIPTSFLRGSTFNNCIILVDECQNMTFQELDTIMTRVGTNSKIIFCGDSRQCDLNQKRNDLSGFDDFYSIVKRMKKYFSFIEFDADDIVRSGIVKEYIINKEAK